MKMRKISSCHYRNILLFVIFFAIAAILNGQKNSYSCKQDNIQGQYWINYYTNDTVLVDSIDFFPLLLAGETMAFCQNNNFAYTIHRDIFGDAMEYAIFEWGVSNENAIFLKDRYYIYESDVRVYCNSKVEQLENGFSIRFQYEGFSTTLFSFDPVKIDNCGFQDRYDKNVHGITNVVKDIFIKKSR